MASETQLDVRSQAFLQPPASGPTAPTTPEDFTAVYRVHFAFVFRTMRALGVPSANLDDAVQDVFVAVHRQLPSFEQRATLRSWIFGIAYNIASNYRRHEYRKGGLLPLEPETQAPTLDPEAELSRAQAWQFLSQFLERLDEGKRAVFVLTQLEGFKALEVADALGIPTNTVYTRLHHVRAAFRDALAAAQPGAAK